MRSLIQRMVCFSRSVRFRRLVLCARNWLSSSSLYFLKQHVSQGRLLVFWAVVRLVGTYGFEEPMVNDSSERAVEGISGVWECIGEVMVCKWRQSWKYREVEIEEEESASYTYVGILESKSLSFKVPIA